MEDIKEFKKITFCLRNRIADLFKSEVEEGSSSEYVTIKSFEKNGGKTVIEIEYHEMFIEELFWLGFNCNKE